MGVKGAVKKAAKKAGRGLTAGTRKIGRAMPGYGELSVDSNREPKQNKAGKSLRKITKGK